jgi:Domain of Unknown Function (DUF1080)
MLAGPHIAAKRYTRSLRLAPIPFLCLVSLGIAQGTHNRLTPQEKAEGWILLFDGKSMAHWQDPRALSPPGDAWTIEDGCIKTTSKPRIGEDLISSDPYGDFELQWDWKIVHGGNSGVKYRIQALPVLSSETRTPDVKKFEDQVDYVLANKSFARSLIPAGGKAQIYVVGFEYQMIDNAVHADAKRGPLYQTAALYSILPPKKDASKPAGEFNHSRLVVRGNHFEHWLNGEQVIDVTTSPEMLKAALAHRWGADSRVVKLMSEQPRKECPVSLQNHGDEAWFRNIKIRRF